MKIRVYYEDTDAGGVVYHSNYLNFCERARSEIFFKEQLLPEFGGGFFVVKSLSADFKAPAKLGDELVVKSELERIKRASFSMRHSIYRGDEVLFTMSVKLGYIKADGSIGILSESERQLLAELFQ